MDFRITQPDLVQLLSHILVQPFSASKNRPHDLEIQRTCESLLTSRREPFECIPNDRICDSYPFRIIFLRESPNTPSSNGLSDLISNAKFARCRQRHVAPCFTIAGKTIARSGTLTSWVELKGLGRAPRLSNGQTDVTSVVRNADLELLNTLSISHISDLMVENRKTKFGVRLSSSEKVDSHGRYADLQLLVMPFPGVEFFAQWFEFDRDFELIFDWAADSNHDVIDASIANFRDFNLRQTINAYVCLLLKNLAKQDCRGVLIHCISGWDRTPLFICLLRLIFWSASAIHSRFSSLDIVYFSLAYDWFLFGHPFPSRVAANQHVAAFAFCVLPHLKDTTLRLAQSISSNNSSPSVEAMKLRLDEASVVFQNAFSQSDHVMQSHRHSFNNSWKNSFLRVFTG